MALTDELRTYARGYELYVNHKLLEIADRIDAEHESDCEDRAALLAEYAAKLRLAGEDE